MTTETDRELAIKRIGEYLLKGWVLTDVPCRNCKVPTLRTKNRATVDFCTVCDLEPEVFQKNDIDDDLLKQKELEYKRALDIELDGPKKQPTQNNVSELLGKYLLKGWTMMQECCETCDGVPYMGNKQKELYCVSCQKFKKVNPLQESTSKKGDTKDLEISQDTESDPKLKMHDLSLLNNSNSDPSKLMGQLLLQGWTMLDSCCHECNVPLMKKGAELLCVACDKRIDHETEEDMELEELELEMPAYKNNTKAVLETPSVERVPKRVKTKDILFEKIEELGIRLSKTSRADEIIETCTAIESCASAIKSLKNIK
ncbi:hypothetical protein HDV06_007030 [Boothiomyces sp. JEL0866]|nr:hypothetical protein HDV06_007030 [Boothiomyces sp. JEL0866]